MADPDSRSGGGGYATPEIQDLMRELYAREDEAMRRALTASSAAGLPAIQIAATDGAVLALLLRLSGARRVVEIGTLGGYSALWLLRGLPPDGLLWTCESSAEHRAVAEQALAHEREAGRVQIIGGPALETLPGLERHGPFDAVFVDADKESYPAYGRWALTNLRPGGLLLADNAFAFGALVTGGGGDGRASAAAVGGVRELHRLAAERFSSAVTLPTADGLLVAIA